MAAMSAQAIRSLLLNRIFIKMHKNIDVNIAG